jgi:hypothetical protein
MKVAGVFPWSAAADEVRAAIQSRNQKWAASPTAKDWVRDYYPNIWSEVAECRLEYHLAESLTRADRVKKVAHSCGKIPWCVPCSLAKGHERMGQALDKIARATPKDMERRVVPWTLSTVYGDDGSGPMALSKDIGRYAKAVDHFLHEVYDAERGEIGWIMSYQDFGEKAFAMRNPHWHLTLIGRRWRDGKMESLPTPNLLVAKTKERIFAQWDNALAAWFPGVKMGNMRIEQPAVGRGAFWKWIKYEVRELVDLRKLLYHQGSRRVWWKKYHYGHERVEFNAGVFAAGLDEYRERLRPDRPNRLHRDGGFMVGTSLDKLAKEIGGQPERHDEQTCPCKRCDRWLSHPGVILTAAGWESEERTWAAV